MGRRSPPAYHVATSLPAHSQEQAKKTMLTTTASSSAHALVTLASEGGEHAHEGLNPAAVGAGTLLFLLLLLWVTTRFNRDR